MKNSFFRVLSVIALLTFGLMTVNVHAQDLNAVKSRIAARLSKIDELKSSGAIGENNRGLVEVRSGDAAAAGIVSAENDDREAVYADIAKKTGTSADAVGRARAKQILAASARGVWLQRDDGSWFRK